MHVQTSIRRVAKFRTILKAIEESEDAKVKPLAPLKPMLEQLMEYMEKTDTPRLENAAELEKLIGDATS